MYYAIVTKFIGADFRGSRVKAARANHDVAARALAQKLSWHGPWVGAECGEGYAYVHAGEPEPGFSA